MDSLQKKSGFLAGFRFSPWRSEPPVDKENKEKPYRTAEAGHTPPMPRVGFHASPESPAKRASAAQMSSRKILEQPRGPSSKLSNVVNSADFPSLSSSAPKATNFSSSTTPKATNFASLSSYNTRPGAYSSATTPRNMFRQSIARERPGFAFSPKVPYNTIKESFPPATPGRGFRAPTTEVNGHGLSRTTAANLFPMRVSSPPPELSGEALAKQVPDRAGRVGSVYADEFLGHLVPPGLDDLQRRQWLCILDLRRLKYAADEIFVKKDWKLNILSFAKEYEKSRSLIMLRYGLYEFKTKPSAEYEKQWQKDNGIPTSDDESRPNGAQGPAGRQLKRRAEDDLTQADTALKASSANMNKRRATERPPLVESTPLASNKRKAEVVEEPDENQRSKTQKTPSASKNVMDKIFNSPQNKEAAGVKPLKPLSQSSATPRSNPFAVAPTKTTNGIFASSTSKEPSASKNIFAHLENPSGNGAADADSESEGDDASEVESDGQDVSQSDEPSVAVSGGIATPNYDAGLNSSKPAVVGITSVSSASSEASEAGKGLSLFERISRGPDGKALRYLGPEDSTPQPTSENGRSASPEKDQRAAAADYTWKPNAPLNFTSQTGSPFKPSSTPNPLLAPKASATPKPTEPQESQDSDAARDTPKPTFSQAPSIFAPKPQNGAMNFSSIFAAKPPEPTSNAPSLFSQQPQEPPTSNASSIFAKEPQDSSASGASIFAPSKPAGAEAKPFGANIFGQAKANDQAGDAPVGAASLFGAKVGEAGTNAVKADPIFQSQTLFGNGAKSEDAKSPTPPSNPLFVAKPQETSSTPQAPSIFAANVAKPASSIFGSTSSAPAFTPTSASGELAAAQPAASLTNGQPVSALFGANTLKPGVAAETENKAPATEAKSIFGGFGAPAGSGSQPESKPLFGAAENAQTEPSKSLFGNAPASTPASSGSIFNFGASSSQPTASQGGPSTSFGSVGTSFTSVGSGDQPKFHNPFTPNADGSATMSFNFGGGPSGSANQAGPTPFVFGGGSSSGGNDQGGSAPFVFGASTSASSSTPAFGAQGSAPAISFGAGSQSAASPAPQSNIFNSAAGGATPGGLFNFSGGPSQSIFSAQKPPMAANLFNLAPPAGGTSTGTNSPFTFGGASSLATTPATGTPEPGAEHEDRQQQADGDEATQEQISLAEGGPGEEDEDILHEVRAKAMKLVMSGGGSDSEAGSGKKDDKSPWKVQGVGPFRLLRHKTTGAVRMLLRQEPSGRVALNKLVLPDFKYKTEPPAGKYIKLTTAKDDGSGLETWMLQLKTKEAAQALVEALEANKGANKK